MHVLFVTCIQAVDEEYNSPFFYFLIFLSFFQSSILIWFFFFIDRSVFCPQMNHVILDPLYSKIIQQPVDGQKKLSIFVNFWLRQYLVIIWGCFQVVFKSFQVIFRLLLGQFQFNLRLINNFVSSSVYNLNLEMI